MFYPNLLNLMTLIEDSISFRAIKEILVEKACMLYRCKAVAGVKKDFNDTFPCAKR